MRGHYTNYFEGVSNFKEFRLKLVILYTDEALHKVLVDIREIYADFQFV